MCDNHVVLIIFLILKIILLLVLPIVVYVLYRKENKLFDSVGIINIIFIMFLIIMRLASNACITNSNISYLVNDDKSQYINESSDSFYEAVYSAEQYLNNESKEVYHYDISTEPLKNVLLSCSDKSYMKNYGDSIAAITSLIANYSETDMNVIEILDYLEENGLVDCNNGFDFDKVFNAIADMYSLNIKQISSKEVYGYVSNGNNVLAETSNKNGESKNFGCENAYIVIYNESNGEYSILNPNDKRYSYFCPNNTIGYGTIIEENQNDRSYTLDEIDSKTMRYFVVEVR